MSLSLKIFLANEGQQKTLRFALSMTVNEACAEIKEKTSVGGPDYGLFKPFPKAAGGQWLDGGKTLHYYEMTNNAELHYLKKHIQMKVQLMDGTVKTVLADQSLPVGRLSAVIGEKLGVRGTEEYSLQSASNPKEWLRAEQSLSEQGVEVSQMLLYKKKYFYSDGVIDKSDAITLHLMYVQSRDAIVSGEQPVTHAEARDLAALQCQVEYQNYDPKKHVKGFLEAVRFLPPHFHKEKSIEAEVFKEWSKLVGSQEANVKYRYVQLCRSLKTYGITAFQVKFMEQKGDKKKGGLKGPELKSKQVLALGVTREAVLLLNNESKEILYSWPLTTLKRWNAEGDQFTLDFGAYADSYLVFKTEQSDAISDMISGYIDIILKARKDPNASAKEEPTAIGQLESVGRPPQGASGSVSVTYYGNFTSYGEASKHNVKAARAGVTAQKVPIKDLRSAFQAMDYLMEDLQVTRLGQSTALPTKIPTAQLQKQMESDVGQLQKAGEELSVLTKNPQSLNRFKVDELARHCASIVESVSGAAKSSGELQQPLIQGTQALIDAFRHMFATLDEMEKNPGKAAELRPKFERDRDTYQQAIGALQATMKGAVADQPSQALLTQNGHLVGVAARRLADVSGPGLRQMPERDVAEPLEKAIAQLLDDCSRVEFQAQAFAPGAVVPAVAESFNAQFVTLNHDAKAVQAKLNGINNKDLRESLIAASQDVLDALRALKLAAQSVDVAESENTLSNFAVATDEINRYVDQMKTANGDSKRVVEAIKGAVAAANRVVVGSKKLAEGFDRDNQNVVLGTAKNVAADVSNLTKSGKLFLSNLQDQKAEAEFLSVADQLKADSNRLADESTKVASLGNVRAAIKVSAAQSAALINAARVATASIDHRVEQIKLLAAAAASNEANNRLLDDLNRAGLNPNSESAQQQMIETAKNGMNHTVELIAASKRALAKVGDPVAKADLREAGDALTKNMQDLMSALKAASSNTSADVEEALESLSATSTELDSAQFLAQSGNLRMQDASPDSAVSLVNAGVRSLQTARDRLVNAVQSNPKKVAATSAEFSRRIGQIGEGARMVAATTADKGLQERVITKAQNVVNQAVNMVKAARLMANNRNDEELPRLFRAATGKVDSACAELVVAAKGLDTKELDDVLAAVATLADQVTGQVEQPDAKSADQANRAVQTAAKTLNGSITQVIDAAANKPKHLNQAAKVAVQTLASLVDAASDAATLNADKSVSEKIVKDTRTILSAAAQVLNAAKTTAADVEYKDSLVAAAKELADLLGRLAATLGVGNNREVDLALEQIMNLSQTLGSSGKGLPTRTLPMALLDLNESLRDVGGLSSKVVVSARRGQKELGESATETAQALKRVAAAARATVQANTAPTPPQDFAEVGDELYSACRVMTESVAEPAKVLAEVRTLAGATAKMLAMAKAAAAKELNEQKQKAVLAAAGNLTRATAQVAKAAKAISSREPDADKQLTEATGALSAATEEVQKTVAKPPTGAPISREEAVKVMDAVRGVATASTRLITAAAGVSQRPDDPEATGELNEAARQAKDTLKDVQKVASRLQPGIAECDELIEVVELSLGELDSASITAAVGDLRESLAQQGQPVPAEQSAIELLKESVDRARLCLDGLSEILNATRLESSTGMGQASLKMLPLVPLLFRNAIWSSATTTDKKQQESILQQAKEMAEAALALLQSCKACSSAPSADGQNEAAGLFKKCQHVFENYLNSFSSGQEHVQALTDAVAAVQAALDALNGAPANPRSYDQAKDDMEAMSKHLAGAIRRLVQTDRTNVASMASSAKELSSILPQMLEAAHAGAFSTKVPEVKDRLKQKATELGQAGKRCVSLSLDALSDPNASSKMGESFTQVRMTLTDLLEIAKQGAVAELKLDQAMQRFQKVSADMDTNLLFASAGQLEPNSSRSTAASDLSEAVKQSGGRLAAKITEAVQIGRQGTLEQLADKANETADALDSLAVNGRDTAAIMLDLKSQSGTLGATKAVAVSCTGFFEAAKIAIKNPGAEANQVALTESSSAVGQAIQALLQLAKESETASAASLDELRKCKALMQSLLKEEPAAADGAKPSEIVMAARRLAGAAAHMAANTNDLDQLQKNIQEAAEATKLMFSSAKGAARAAPEEVRTQVLDDTKNSVKVVMQLLEALNLQLTTRTAGQEVSDQARALGEQIQTLVDHARSIPGAGDLTLEEMANGDLEAVASKELNDAVSAIEAATAQLLAAKPDIYKQKEKIGFDTSDVTVAIVDSALAISKATQALVAAAARGQKERVEKQRDNPLVYKKDSMWADGLISASRGVAGATQLLVKTANNAILGTAQEEELVAVAKAVAAATAHLVTASRAKSDAGSKSHAEIQSAAKAVAQATSAMVDAARQAQQEMNKTEEEDLAANYTGNAVKQLEQQMKVLKLEKELEKARKSMLAARKTDYSSSGASRASQRFDLTK